MVAWRSKASDQSATLPAPSYSTRLLGTCASNLGARSKGAVTCVRNVLAYLKPGRAWLPSPRQPAGRRRGPTAPEASVHDAQPLAPSGINLLFSSVTGTTHTARRPAGNHCADAAGVAMYETAAVSGWTGVEGATPSPQTLPSPAALAAQTTESVAQAAQLCLTAGSLHGPFIPADASSARRQLVATLTDEPSPSEGVPTSSSFDDLAALLCCTHLLSCEGVDDGPLILHLGDSFNRGASDASVGTGSGTTMQVEVILIDEDSWPFPLAVTEPSITQLSVSQDSLAAGSSVVIIPEADAASMYPSLHSVGPVGELHHRWVEVVDPWVMASTGGGDSLVVVAAQQQQQQWPYGTFALLCEALSARAGPLGSGAPNAPRLAVGGALLSSEELPLLDASQEIGLDAQHALQQQRCQGQEQYRTWGALCADMPGSAGLAEHSDGPWIVDVLLTFDNSFWPVSGLSEENDLQGLQQRYGRGEEQQLQGWDQCKHQQGGMAGHVGRVVTAEVAATQAAAVEVGPCATTGQPAAAAACDEPIGLDRCGDVRCYTRASSTVTTSMCGGSSCLLWDQSTLPNANSDVRTVSDAHTLKWSDPRWDILVDAITEE